MEEGQSLDIDDVRRTVNRVGVGKVDYFKAAAAVGDLRPDASVSHRASRAEKLYWNRLNIEHWGRKLNENFKIDIEIVPKGKKIDQKLSPELFTLTRMLTTREYEKKMDPAVAQRIILEGWSVSLFPEEGMTVEKGKSGDQANKTKSLADHVERDFPFYDAVSKREKYVDLAMRSLKDDRKLRDLLKKRVKKLSKDEKEEWVTRTIMSEVLKNRIKDIKASMRKTLSSGMELEIFREKGYWPKRGLEKKLDQTEIFAGVPVVYDALRELPLPYSEGTRGQLRAVYELYKMGLIPEGHGVGMHLNIGGVDWAQGMKDVLILCQILDATNLSNQPNTFRHSKHKKSLKSDDHSLKQEEIMDKPFLQFDQGVSPVNIPARIRNGGVLEIRGVLSMSELPTIIRTVNNIYCLAEAAAAGIRLRSGRSKDLERDRELAGIWEYVKLESAKIDDEHGLDREDYLRGIVGNTRISKNAGDRYGDLRWKTVRRTALAMDEISRGKRSKNNYYVAYRRLLLEARKRVNETLSGK